MHGKLVRVTGLVVIAAMALGVTLPRRGPTPESRPEPAPQVETTPEPAPAPTIATPAEKPPASEGIPERQTRFPQPAANAPDADVPKPESKPEPKPEPPKDEPAPQDLPVARPDEKAADEEQKESPPPPPPIEKEDPAAYAACIADLKAIGAKFTERPPIDDGNGCGIDKPVEITAALPGVAVSPEATVRCETALQLARMARDMVAPIAKVGLEGKAKLTSINQASGYVCRKRNGASTGKISEHARGNGIDIASMSFGKETIPMKIVTQEDSSMEAAFQRAINAVACLYFTTVLSPGSDEAHKDHMHLDVIERKDEYRYCR